MSGMLGPLDLAPPIGVDNVGLTEFRNAQLANQAFGPGHAQAQAAAIGAGPGSTLAGQIAAKAALEAQGAIARQALRKSSGSSAAGTWSLPTTLSPEAAQRLRERQAESDRTRAWLASLPPPRRKNRWWAYWLKYGPPAVGATIGVAVWYILVYAFVPIWWDPFAWLPAAVCVFIVIEDLLDG